MIEILGLFSALFAGFLADGFMRSSGSADDEGIDIQRQQDDSSALDLSGFQLGRDVDDGDDGGADDGMPQSNDTPAPMPANETLAGGALADTLFGQGGDDVITGGAGNDILGGRGGADTLFGDFGEDYMIGGDGTDLLDGGQGDDTIYGEDGADTLIGGGGNDVLYAGAGNDTVSGDAGNDALFGGEGQDSVDGGAGDDTLDGGLGDDLVIGGDGADEVFGDAGNDTLWGSSAGGRDTQVDYLSGGAGDDVLMLGLGDYGHGGTGADQFVLTEYGADDGVVQITDFDPAEDYLVILYSPELGAAPILALQNGPNGTTSVLLDGQIVASLTTSDVVDADNIILRAQ